MKVKKELVLRELAGDYALIPIGSDILKNNGLFSLSETGARIWQLLPEAETERDIVDALLEEYETDRGTLEKDVREFLEQLRESEIL